MSQTPEAPKNPFSKHDLISTKTGNMIHRVVKVNEDGSMMVRLSSSPQRSRGFLIKAHEVGEWVRRG